MARIGVIGGSGLYEMDSIAAAREIRVETPFGAPSDAYVVGKLGGTEVAFLARHGRGHRILPAEINHRANIFGFKKLGVERIIGVSAVGSLREDYRPLDVVVVDQYFDRTRRATTFFGEGLAVHVGFADPVCPELARFLADAADACGARVHRAGTYVNMEGPAFSTRAESEFYRRNGFDVIGMTNLPEAKLSREAEICYATLAMVTDYDCWKTEDEPVSVEQVLNNLRRNAELGREIVRKTVEILPAERTCACGSALAGAIITPRDQVPPATLKKLRPIVGRYFPSSNP